MSAATESKKPLTVVFCLPGRSFERRFLLSWTTLFAACLQRGIAIKIAQEYSSVVHFARAKCLGGDVLAGKHQVPFQGTLDYDYIMWIDSDVVFKPDDFFALLESPHPVTAGYYMMEDDTHVATVENWDIDFFLKNASFKFLTVEDIKARKERYIPVSYTGMGWMLIRRGAIERIEYPWFYRPAEVIGGKVIDMASDDVAFCKNLMDAGVPIMLDTQVRVGHIKNRVL